MAVIKVKWFVTELTNVMSQFDQVKVYRSDAEDGTYAEITGPATRIDLVAGTTQYEYIDATAPDNTYWYRTAYFNSSTLLESSMSDAIQGTDMGIYVSLQDIRDEGFTTDDLDDDRALALSVGWQAWFEDVTGQFFTPKELTLEFDGDGSRLLQLPVPIISIDNLYINDENTAVDTDRYVVYNRNNAVQDDRRNPRIKLKRTVNRDIFTGSYLDVFEIGDLNQTVEGTFGYVEADGSVPFAVKRAILILISTTAENLADAEIDQLRAGKVVEEVTDRHRIQYTDLFYRLQVWNPTGITEVDNAIKRYRSPMRVTAPRTMPWHRV